MNHTRHRGWFPGYAARIPCRGNGTVGGAMIGAVPGQDFEPAGMCPGKFDGIFVGICSPQCV